VQLLLHSWNEQDAKWAEEPIAFTQGTVTPMRVVNGTLFLFGPSQAESSADWDRDNVLLPGGRYLVKVYVDGRGQLAADPALLLGAEDFAGQAELNKPRWREGFPQAASISGTALVKEGRTVQRQRRDT
jgi:hypothetical protein